MVRVFHCDDSSAFRLLVREMLADKGDIEYAGDAASLAEALERLPGADPDVVLVDLFEPDRPDELLTLLGGAAPGARLIVYSGMPEGSAPDGAVAHVHKSVPFDELHRTITRAAAS